MMPLILFRASAFGFRIWREEIIIAPAFSERTGLILRSDHSLYGRALAEQISSHHPSIFVLIASRTSRVLASFSSRVPWKLDGSAKFQFNRLAMPGNMGR